VTLGTPHRGAPLEQAVHASARVLDAVPETRGLARLLTVRSAGIKDLRLGTILDDDGTPIEDLPGVRSRALAGTVTADPAHPVGWVVGDLLVQPDSATGWDGAEPGHVGATHHLDLLRDDAVYAQLLAWLRS